MKEEKKEELKRNTSGIEIWIKKYPGFRESVRAGKELASEKVANTVATFLKEGSAESVFKRAIGFSYQQVVSDCVKVPITRMASKKVTNMVGTFSPDDSNSFL